MKWKGIWTEKRLEELSKTVLKFKTKFITEVLSVGLPESCTLKFDQIYDILRKLKIV